jgi:methyl-accepting chemotaxis protein
MVDKLDASNGRVVEKARGGSGNDPRSLCEMAKIDHVMFKKRVTDAVAGRKSWKTEEVPDHHG